MKVIDFYLDIVILLVALLATVGCVVLRQSENSIGIRKSFESKENTDDLVHPLPAWWNLLINVTSVLSIGYLIWYLYNRIDLFP